MQQEERGLDYIDSSRIFRCIPKTNRLQSDLWYLTPFPQPTSTAPSNRISSKDVDDENRNECEVGRGTEPIHGMQKEDERLCCENCLVVVSFVHHSVHRSDADFPRVCQVARYFYA